MRGENREREYRSKVGWRARIAVQQRFSPSLLRFRSFERSVREAFAEPLLAANEVSEPQGAPTSLPVEHSEADAAEQHALCPPRRALWRETTCLIKLLYCGCFLSGLTWSNVT